MNARLCLVLNLLLALPLVAGGGLGAAPPPAPDHAQVAQALHRAPLLFIQNVGQFDPRARFQVHGGNGALWLAEDALWITLMEPPPREERTNLRGLRDLGGLPTDDQPRRGVNLKLSFVGANPHPRLEPFHRLETHVSYFIGNDPAQWHADVPVWGGVRYVELYPGVDLEMSGEGGQWQPRLLAQPGADLRAVRLRVEGAEAVEIEGDHLRLRTALGPVALPPLLTGAGAPVQPTIADDSVIFTPPPLSLPFPIPVDSPPNTPAGLLYSTFLGGSSDDLGYAIAVDTSGAAYVTGETWSYNFPTTPGAFQTQQGFGFCNWPPVVCPDAFVTKLNPRGNGLVYSTYLGGANRDYGYAIALDAAGAAYITGYTYGGFPVTPGAFQTTFGGNRDAFVTKLNAMGSALGYSTYLGGDWEDYGHGIAVDASGSAYVVGFTRSPSFPTTPGAFQPTCAGGYLVPCEDAFVTRLNAMGNALEYSTYLGGGRGDYGYGIAVDANGEAYVTGDTDSTNFPTTPGAFQTTLAGWTDVFVTKLNATGSGLAYSTLLGGNSYDHSTDIAVDVSGAAFVTGITESSNFPITPGAFQPASAGGYDAFVTKLNQMGSGLVYSTFLGGSNNECTGGGCAIAVEAEAAYVTGYTYSSDFPITPGAFQTTCGGCPNTNDAFITKLNMTGSTLLYSTFLGGSGPDPGQGIAVDGSGVAYITGSTWSGDFPITLGAFQTTPQGAMDSFVTKLELIPNPLTPTPTLTATPTSTPTVTATPPAMAYRVYLPLILNTQ